VEGFSFATPAVSLNRSSSGKNDADIYYGEESLKVDQLIRDFRFLQYCTVVFLVITILAHLIFMDFITFIVCDAIYFGSSL
jgi:hypothetical protein